MCGYGLAKCHIESGRLCDVGVEYGSFAFPTYIAVQLVLPCRPTSPLSHSVCSLPDLTHSYSYAIVIRYTRLPVFHRVNRYRDGRAAT